MKLRYAFSCHSQFASRSLASADTGKVSGIASAVRAPSDSSVSPGGISAVLGNSPTRSATGATGAMLSEAPPPPESYILTMHAHPARLARAVQPPGELLRMMAP